jgi:hypothetical protein
MADDHAAKEDHMALTMTRLEREAFLAGVHVGGAAGKAAKLVGCKSPRRQLPDSDG